MPDQPALGVIEQSQLCALARRPASRSTTRTALGSAA
jgi:hypothetical protein